LFGYDAPLVIQMEGARAIASMRILCPSKMRSEALVYCAAARQERRSMIKTTAIDPLMAIN
jgi:hypothetical protein